MERFTEMKVLEGRLQERSISFRYEINEQRKKLLEATDELRCAKDEYGNIIKLQEEDIRTATTE